MNAKIMPTILGWLNVSWKIIKEATIGRNNDKRCAASERTIPANSTALDIMINTVGNKIPNARKIGVLSLCARYSVNSNPLKSGLSKK